MATGEGQSEGSQAAALTQLVGNGPTRRRLLQAAGLASAAAGGLGACAPRVVGLDVEAKSLDIANGAEPLTLDPHKASGTWENNIIGNILTGLTTDDEKAEPVPGMALRWEATPDGLRWRFFLRQTTWSDGVPVTAHDFVYALQRILNPDTLAQYASILYPIRNAEKVNSGELPPDAVGAVAVDDLTLDILLEHPAPYLPQLLTHYTAFPVPKHVVEKHGSAWTRPENFVGNGAFVLVDWKSNYSVSLKRNPLFYDAENVNLERLYFYPTTNNRVAVRQVLAKERAWSTDFPDSQYQQLKQEIPDLVRVAPYLLLQYFSFRVTRQPTKPSDPPLPPTPFEDKRVRRALTMAIDRQFIATRIYRTGVSPAYSFIPPGMFGYPQGARQTWADESQEARQAEARRLLAEAGYGPDKPLRFEFKHRNSGDNPRVAVVVQENWKMIGVECTLQGTETQIHYDNLRAKNFVAGDGGWVADYNDPRNYLYLLETRTGPQNYPGFNNPEFDELMRRQDNEPDLIKRAGILREAEQLMLDEAPVCPIVFGVSKNLIDPRIEGYADNLTDIHRARYFKIKSNQAADR